jgi:hypothetical protein
LEPVDTHATDQAMHRFGSVLAVAGIALVLGALLGVRLAAIPVLEISGGLVDLNLGTALARSIVLRASEVALIGAIVHAAVIVPRGPRSGGATLALLMLGTCLVERAWAAPALYAAWGRVDRVAELPVKRLEDAQHLALQHDALLVGIALLGMTALWLLLNGLPGPANEEQPAGNR